MLLGLRVLFAGLASIAVLLARGRILINGAWHPFFFFLVLARGVIKCPCEQSVGALTANAGCYAANNAAAYVIIFTIVYRVRPSIPLFLCCVLT